MLEETEEIEVVAHYGSGLDTFIASDLEHALRWCAQPFVNDKKYSVRIIVARRTKCCRAIVSTKTVRRLTVTEFLAEFTRQK